jgi:hypothetical protein
MNTYNVILIGKDKELNFYLAIHINANSIEHIKNITIQYCNENNLNAQIDEIEVVENNVTKKIGVVKEFGKVYFK